MGSDTSGHSVTRSVTLVKIQYGKLPLAMLVYNFINAENFFASLNSILANISYVKMIGFLLIQPV